jgi:hypothetical protein
MDLPHAATYAKKQAVNLTPGSDTAKYDAASNILYIVTGGRDVDMKTCNLEAINPDTGAKLGFVLLPSSGKLFGRA